MFGKSKRTTAAQPAQFNLTELAADAAQEEAAEQAAFVATHGPINHDDVDYGSHGSHGSRSVR